MAPFGGLLRGPTALVADLTQSAASVAATAVRAKAAPAAATAAATSPLPRSSATGSSAGGVAPSTTCTASTPLPTQAEVSRTLQLIRDHPQMTDLDKVNVVSVLAQAPRFAAAVANAPPALLPRGYTRERQPDWEQYMSLKGIVASSQKPVPPEKVYKIRGVGEVEGEPEVIYHFMSNVDAVREWDPLLRSGDVLRRDPQPALPVLESGFDTMLYGVPGFSLVFSERQFLVRVMGLELPDRTRVIAVYSLPDGHTPPEGVRDVGVPARAVRAHMAVTGAVITPLVAVGGGLGQHQQQQHIGHHHHNHKRSSGGGSGGGGGGGRRASGSHGHGRHHRHHGAAGTSPSSSPTHRHQQQQQLSPSSFSSSSSSITIQQRCEVTLLVQVDPRGGVPPSVVHACALTMPANLQRVRVSVARASASRGASLLAEQRAARGAALASARRLYSESARAFGAMGGGGGSVAGLSSGGGAGPAPCGVGAPVVTATLSLSQHGHAKHQQQRDGGEQQWRKSLVGGE